MKFQSRYLHIRVPLEVGRGPVQPRLDKGTCSHICDRWQNYRQPRTLLQCCFYEFERETTLNGPTWESYQEPDIVNTDNS